jgi:Ethylbenzene dehydrogenase/Prokaryotic cytochrome b561
MPQSVTFKSSLHSTAAPPRPRSDAPTAVLHMALFVTLVFSLLTGFRIAADSLDATWTRALSSIWMQGSVTYWHAVSAYTLLGISIAYVAFLFRAHLQARVAIDAARIHAVVAADRQGRWQAINVILYWIAFIAIGIAGATGTLLYIDATLLPHDLVTAIHRVAAWSIIAYALIHATAQLVMGGVRQLLKVLTPRLTYIAAGAIALLIGTVAAAGMLGVDRATLGTLNMARVQTPPQIDGEGSDEAWAAADVLDVHTVRGVNFPNGEVTVHVRAAHDEQNAYFLFEWADATHSQKHLPLVKAADGWKILEHRYGIQDENDYYEDKFGVMLSSSPEIAGGGSSHLGKQPIPGKPGSPNERGLHYTTDGSIVDVWHWKSARTGPLAQLDDNYFGSPMEPDADPKKRYTGGYTQDPETGGGFIQNWEKLEHGLKPLHLPKSPSQIADLQTADLDPTVGDTVQWSMNLADTVPYSPQADQYAVGTVIPSVVIEKPFEGDRGDVRGVGVWRDGTWHLEVTRKLQTTSEFDQPIADGIYLWVVAFDHAQTRHTQHLRPLAIELE